MDAHVRVKQNCVEMLSKQKEIFLHEAKWILRQKPQNDKCDEKNLTLTLSHWEREHEMFQNDKQ
ncbi:hypothetical protein J6T66_04575 [bacterium]|nr:hypothetical protein [bacterium]